MVDSSYLFIYTKGLPGRNVNIKLFFKVRAPHALSLLSFHFSTQHLFFFNIAMLLSGIEIELKIHLGH